MPFTKTNIKVLREEKRLTKLEFADLMGVSEQTVTLWEKGKIEPTIEQIEKMCPILRIHVEDFLERDILKERQDAGKRLVKSKERSNYNWYYGSKKTMSFYISYLILIPILVIIGYFVGKYFAKNAVSDKVLTPELFQQIIIRIRTLFIFLPVGITSSIYVLIYVFKNRIITFRWWFLTWLGLVITILIIVCCILTPVLYGFSIYKGIIKKGKVR